MTTSLSAVVLGYLALVALISMSAAAGVPLASAARTGAVVAELLLIAHAAVDLAAALRKAPTDPAVHFGYVMISVALLPLLVRPAPADAAAAALRGRHAVLALACALAAVVVIRQRSTA